MVDDQPTHEVIFQLTTEDVKMLHPQAMDFTPKQWHQVMKGIRWGFDDWTEVVTNAVMDVEGELTKEYWQALVDTEESCDDCSHRKECDDYEFDNDQLLCIDKSSDPEED